MKLSTITLVLAFLAFTACTSLGATNHDLGPGVQAQCALPKPVMGVITMKVVDSTVEFRCRDEYDRDVWRANVTLFQATDRTTTTVAESAAFSYRFEESVLWPRDYDEQPLATHYGNASHFRFACEGWFPQDMASVTVWMQGRVQQRNISVTTPVEVRCSKEFAEPFRCDLFYHEAVEHSWRFTSKVLTDLRTEAVQEDVGAPPQESFNETIDRR